MSQTTKTRFFEAWAAKGMPTRYRSQWSNQSGERFVFTVWNQVQHGADTEVFFDKATKCSTYYCPSGGEWVSKKPGQDYMQRARECMRKGIYGEVITLNGTRNPDDPSKVDSADVMSQLYWIEFTEIRDDGLIRGIFHHEKDGKAMRRANENAKGDK